MSSTEEQNQHAQPTDHPFILAQSWQQELNTDPELTMAKIATREGISRS